MNYAVQKESSGRLAGLVVVVAFHLALIYALVHGLARQIVEVIRAPLETKIIEEIKAPPPDKPPPPPPPKLTMPPPPYIPPPEVQVQVPVVMAPTITAVTDVKPPPEPVRTAPVVDAKTCDKPAYPPASLRANETGTVRLRFLIDVDGKVLDSRIEQSSGSRRLDEAARGGLSLCKFRPATLNGRPEQTWGRIDYVWKIE